MKIDNENVIKFLNKIENWIEIETLKTNTVFYEKDKAMLKEIKGIVEYYEKSEHFTKVYLPIPRDEGPDEELVEEALNEVLGVCLKNISVNLDGLKICSGGGKLRIKSAIRSLLQNRQACVTREEVEECFNHQCYIVENIIGLLKSKGISVKGE